MNFLAELIFRIAKQNDKKFLFNSFPDFSDNALAFFIHLDKKYEFTAIWLISNINEKDELIAFANSIGFKNRVKFINKKSLLGVYHFFTSKFVFTTHGIYKKFGKIQNHKLINLWHGMPIKNIEGLADPKKTLADNSNYYIVTNQYYKNLFSKIFNIEKEKIFITGLPRNDMIFDSSKIYNQIDKRNFSKKILWMPTYRKNDIFSKNFNLRLKRINNIFKSKNYICVIKTHPLDSRFDQIDEMSNIKIIDEIFLRRNHLIFYQIFSEVDLLITDFSSVCIDFMLTEKPIIFFAEDFDKYNNSTGFIFDDLEKIFPGKIIKSFNDFERKIENLYPYFISNTFKDPKKYFHDVQSNFSEKLESYIFSL